VSSDRQWTLGSKLALVAAPFAFLALGAIAALVWMAWQLDGGAAAVNEAGRMRMQAYRLVLSAGGGQTAELKRGIDAFERSLRLLREGDAERPLFVPWDVGARASFAGIEQDWSRFRLRLAAAGPASADLALGTEADVFVARIDAFVTGIEAHMARWTALMYLLQVATMGLAVLGTAVLLYVGYLFVLEPVGLLKQAIHRVQGGDLGARVEVTSTDEFAALAGGFNTMAGQLRSMYQNLENRVREASRHIDLDRLAISPQCGFASTAAGNPVTEDIEYAKLQLAVRVAERIWRQP
jgi:two-component system nitrate/nitrite sensor histidine kinase NarX